MQKRQITILTFEIESLAERTSLDFSNDILVIVGKKKKKKRRRAIREMRETEKGGDKEFPVPYTHLGERATVGIY